MLELLQHAIDTHADPIEKKLIQLTRAYVLVEAGRAEEAKPTFEAARRELERVVETGDQSLWIRDQLLMLAAVQGDREKVFRESEALLQITAKDRWRFPHSHESTARAYVLIGELDRALPHIEQALAMPSQQGLTAAYLRLEAIWDPLRNNPRFQKLIDDAEAALKAQPSK